MQENPASDSTQPSTAPTPQAMQREVETMHAKLLELRRLQAAGRRQFVLTALVIIFMFTAFMAATYLRIARNFDTAAVQKAVNERGGQVLPLATELLIQTGRNTMPAYREAVVQALHARGPDLASKTVARFELVPEENGKLMQDKLQISFAKVIKRIEPEFKAAFPTLSDERRQHLVQDFMMKQIDVENKRVVDRGTQLYTNDLIQMHQVLEKFKLPDGAAAPKNEELERQFLHTMVMLLDDQVDLAFNQPALDAENTGQRLHPTTRPVTPVDPEAKAN